MIFPISFFEPALAKIISPVFGSFLPEAVKVLKPECFSRKPLCAGMKRSHFPGKCIDQKIINIVFG